MKNSIRFEIKAFDELSPVEIYEILHLRSEVFVVEQNCIYQDIDHKDHKAFHVLGWVENEIVAYARLFKAGDYFENASIGRVVIHPKARSKKWGHALMNTSINALNVLFGDGKIEISAQTYLLDFYRQHQFKEIEPGYLEDGIPHHRMIRD